jgi:pimeloyl-ACP methyl ester carboxylesterase
MPGLIVWGTRDRFLTPELTHGLADRFSAPCTIRYLPAVGHWTQQEAPGEVNRALEDFSAAATGGA